MNSTADQLQADNDAIANQQEIRSNAIAAAGTTAIAGAAADLRDYENGVADGVEAFDQSIADGPDGGELP